MREKLIQILNDSGLTYMEFADRIGYSPVTVHYWITGRNHPTIEAVIRICTVYAVSADWLLGIHDEREV